MDKGIFYQTDMLVSGQFRLVKTWAYQGSWTVCIRPRGTKRWWRPPSYSTRAMQEQQKQGNPVRRDGRTGAGDNSRRIIDEKSIKNESQPFIRKKGSLKNKKSALSKTTINTQQKDLYRENHKKKGAK